MAFPLIPVALGGLALAWLAFRKMPGEGDALDAAARDGAGTGTGDAEGGGYVPPQIPSGRDPTTGAANVTANAPVTSTGQVVQTPATATEPAGASIPLVEPSYQPRTQSPDAQTTARSLAPQVDAALKANPHGYKYAPNVKERAPAKDLALVALVKQFQAATGLVQDGLYGPVTAGALMFYLGSPPPAPYFYIRDRVIKVFRPRTS